METLTDKELLAAAERHTKWQIIGLALMVVMLITFTIALYRLIEIGNVAKDVQNEYALQWQNFTCFKANQMDIFNNKTWNGCYWAGMYYPACPNESKVGNISLGGLA